MAKIRNLSADDEKELALVGRALSSAIRIQIIKLLYLNSYNVAEIAEKLNIPASSAALNIKILEEAGLIHTEVQPGERGTMKLCSRKSDFINIRLQLDPMETNRVQRISMPIGAYTACEPIATCGIVSAKEYIGGEDMASNFFRPERVEAQLLWSSGGYVEYKFPSRIGSMVDLKKLSLSMEICSEAPNYREDWKSDITLWINGVDCGVWTSPGDFGARRGILNPDWWADGSTQYGLLTTWTVSGQGTQINGESVSDVTLSRLRIEEKPYITIRVGNAENAVYRGGFNIFGQRFGDHAQDINLIFEY